MNKWRLTPKQVAALRERGNQYAFVEFQEDAEEIANVSTTEKVLSNVPHRARGSTLTAEQAKKLALLNDPYAFVDFQESVDELEQQELVQATSGAAKIDLVRKQRRSPSTISKADFKRECRRIFEQYVPLMEKGALRPEHKSFISRNLECEGSERFNVLASLKRYDLGDLGRVRAQFNRERHELTEEKLLEIELAAKKNRNGKP